MKINVAITAVLVAVVLAAKKGKKNMEVTRKQIIQIIKEELEIYMEADNYDPDTAFMNFGEEVQSLFNSYRAEMMDSADSVNYATDFLSSLPKKAEFNDDQKKEIQVIYDMLDRYDWSLHPY